MKWEEPQPRLAAFYGSQCRFSQISSLGVWLHVHGPYASFGVYEVAVTRASEGTKGEKRSEFMLVYDLNTAVTRKCLILTARSWKEPKDKVQDYM